MLSVVESASSKHKAHGHEPPASVRVKSAFALNLLLTC